MIKINEELKKEIQEKKIYKSNYSIPELYDIIKSKKYNNYKNFLDTLCDLIIYLEFFRNKIADFFINIIYDNLNYILDNMEEDWDLSNETINNRVEFLFNKLKENNYD